jgi:hypothetical protein
MKRRKRFVLVATIVTGLIAASIPAEAQTIFRPAISRAAKHLGTVGSPPERYFLFSPSSAPYNRVLPDHTTQGTWRFPEMDRGLGLFGARPSF